MVKPNATRGDVIPTTDLSDQFEAVLRYPDPDFYDYGGRCSFCGPVRTLAVFDDNSLVRDALAGPGAGHILVVAGGGSKNCALVGGNLASLAEENGWAGIVVDGYIRDRDELAQANVGIRARGAHPRRSDKRGTGLADISVRFAGITIDPGDWIYADRDGMLVSRRPLTLNS